MRKIKAKKAAVELQTEPLIAPSQDPSWDFVDIKGAASLGYVSKATIRRWLTQRRLTRFKFYSRTLISRAELLAKIQKA